LALRYQAKVVFQQVVEPPPLVMTPGQPEMALHEQELEQRMKAAEKYLKKIQGEFRQKGIEARMEIGHGSVVDDIINTARRRDADLIALASHGRSGLAQVFYGSVASGILQKIDRPLLLIRSQTME
jgi:nucleotide-binding universal stress UspA family protein